MYLLSVFSHDWRKNNHLVTQQRPTGWTDFKKKYQMQTQLHRMVWKSIYILFPRVYIMLKQGIWSTGIIVAWTLSIYICPEWMWKASFMFKVPALPHHPGNLCYHLLCWIICWCYYHWWFRIYCLVNKSHIGPRNPAWTWKTISSRLGMATDIKYVHFLLNLFNVALYIHSSSP